MTSTLLFLLLLGGPQGPASNEPQIADNSFLIEEAFNQERGVVQHINVWSRDAADGPWAYAFTQEWPVNPRPKHQLSYTLSAVDAGAGSGIGDLWVNWRYQVRNSSALAVAPRVSLIVPSGDARNGRGQGGVGAEFNLPISVTLPHRLVLHSNAGMTLVPRAKNENGDSGRLSALRFGQSAVWQAHPRFNLLLEFVASREQTLTGPDRRAWETSTLISPGVRWAHNFGALQVVPGVGVPIELADTEGSRWTVLGYLSIEHPFGRTR
jgi:hypothetical protein